MKKNILFCACLFSPSLSCSKILSRLLPSLLLFRLKTNSTSVRKRTYIAEVSPRGSAAPLPGRPLLPRRGEERLGPPGLSAGSARASRTPVRVQLHNALQARRACAVEHVARGTTPPSTGEKPGEQVHRPTDAAGATVSSAGCVGVGALSSGAAAWCACACGFPAGAAGARRAAVRGRCVRVPLLTVTARGTDGARRDRRTSRGRGARRWRHTDAPHTPIAIRPPGDLNQIT